MNKKTERIAIIGLAAFLVGYFAYQVAYGTNESDYKYGYEAGKGEYQQCSNTNTCTVSENLLSYECDHHTGPNFGSVLTYNVDNEKCSIDCLGVFST